MKKILKNTIEEALIPYELWLKIDRSGCPFMDYQNPKEIKVINGVTLEKELELHKNEYKYFFKITYNYDYAIAIDEKNTLQIKRIGYSNKTIANFERGYKKFHHFYE